MPKPQQKKEKVIPTTNLSPTKGLSYVKDGFGGLFEDSVVICMGTASVLTERVVHHPIGGTDLGVDEWVISTRQEVKCIQENMENPFSKDIARAVRKAAIVHLIASGDFTEDTTKPGEIIYNEGNLNRSEMMVLAKKEAINILKEVENQGSISKAGNAPVRPKANAEYFLPYILANGGKYEGINLDLSNLAKNKAVLAEAGLTLLISPAVKKVITTSLGIAPYLTYVDDLQEQTQESVPYLKGVPPGKVRAMILRGIVGGNTARTGLAAIPNDAPAAPEMDVAEAQQVGSQRDSPDKVRAYLEKVVDLGKSATPQGVAAVYLTDSLASSKARESGIELPRLIKKIREYQLACIAYRNNAKKASDERKKRWEEANED